ncbi:MAG: hypothetical protein HY719_15480 [Planctomycetes bacterium]|nr:hypothetical protein [Planctomycetota bacterium]
MRGHHSPLAPLRGLAVLALAGALSARGDLRAGEVRLSDVAFGTPVMGRLPPMEEMRGHVVVLEAFFPEKLERLQLLFELLKKHAKDGLIVVGNLMADDQAREARRGLFTAPPLPVVGFTRVGSAGGGMGSGHCMIFNHEGLCVYEQTGNPDFVLKIEETLAKAPDFLLGERPYRKLGSLATAVRSRAALGKALAEADKLREKEGDEGEEARLLFERLERHAKAQTMHAAFLEGDDPEEAPGFYDALAKTWVGCQYGADAAKRAAALRKDPAFQREIAAMREYEGMMQTLAKEFDPRNEKKGAATAASLAPRVRAFFKNHAGARAAEKVTTLKKEYAVPD